jgi:hypothetical protein
VQREQGTDDALGAAAEVQQGLGRLQPPAVKSLSDDIHLHVLNNSYDRMCP